MTRLRLGAIADDFTGATDLANMLVRAGMRAVQTIGVPAGPLGDDVDAVVVALKSRTCPPQEAIEASLAALHWLQREGAQQVYFKYCSTFDSTPRGNIGPVTDALMDALAGTPNADFTVATPAFPDNGRTVFKGHLFVGDVLLNESGMQNHPLNPMTDANLVRVLQAQVKRKVGLIDYRTVAQGADAVRARIDALRGQGVAIAILDAIANDDLVRVGPALAALPLVTAGSGLALGLARNFGFAPSDAASRLPPPAGMRAIVAGSCSLATNRQVRAFIDRGGAAYRVDALRAAGGSDVVGEALAFARPRLADGAVLVYSTAEPEAIRAVQAQLGVERGGALVEDVLGRVARGLVEAGVRQLVVAGGETAGACVQALGIARLKIGPQIDPGVPWCHADAAAVPGAALHVTLKSGNFGADDFFTRAFALLG